MSSATSTIQAFAKQPGRFRLGSFVKVNGSLAIGLGVLAFYFDWRLFAFTWVISMIFGYALGIFHHMLFSHDSFKARPWLANLGGTLGTLTWRGPMAAPIRYAAMHRMHHRYSDHDGDPHSPIHGRFHAFLGWMWNYSDLYADASQYERIVPQLAKNTFLRWLDRHPDLLQVIWGLLLFVIGTILPLVWGDGLQWQFGIKLMAYGVFVKTALLLLAANAVDLINHGVGYRNYETTDLSTNSALMGVVHLGGAISWHNNHHAHPRYFTVKRQPWEIDVHYWVVKMLSWFGWTSDIKILNDVPVEEKAGKIPARFLRRDAVKTTIMITGRIAFLAVVLIASTSLIGSPISILLKVPGLAVLTVLGGIAFQNLALIGHEGTHFNLANSRQRSAHLGTWVASLVPGHFNVGFATSHAAHHLHTNTDQDPDLFLFAEHYESLWGRLLTGRLAASRRYFWTTIRVAMGKGRPDAALLRGLTEEQVVRLARENLVASSLAWGGYITLAVFAGWNFVVAFAMATAGAVVLSSLRPFLEHEGTMPGRASVARTFTSPIVDLMFGGINYHHAHHLYPAVPSYNIMAFHRWLSTHERLGERPIQTNSLSEIVLLVATGSSVEVKNGSEGLSPVRARLHFHEASV